MLWQYSWQRCCEALFDTPTASGWEHCAVVAAVAVSAGAVTQVFKAEDAVAVQPAASL